MCNEVIKLLPVRKILAPGEEENLELEEEEDAATGAGSTEAFPPRAPGTVCTRRLMTVNQTRPLSGMFDSLSRVLCHVALCFFLFFLSVLCMASSLIPACFICSFARYGFVSGQRLSLFSAA